jgi:diguanylate cyclase (GGDEF)-like protein
MQTVEALKPLPVWLNPDHLVSTARVVMAGHKVKVLGVVEDGELIGIVTSERLASELDNTPLRHVLEPAKLVVTSGTPIRKVAEMFVLEDVDQAPVLQDGRFIGIITATMLLRELGRSWDPLTGLSWSDLLREWGIENLKRNKEVTIIFIDLNDFGNYNKRYGHIVGDKVLRRTAEMLQTVVDPERDVLVRYGGDEFAFGTVRSRIEAEGLADMLMRRMDELRVLEAEEPVTFSTGIYGGKRTRERENVHYAATLDNLINLASKECLRHKEEFQAAQMVKEPHLAVVESQVSIEEPPAAPGGPPVSVLSIHADDFSPTSLDQVVLSVGDGVFTGVNTRSSKSVLESVATATAKALERAFPGTNFHVEAINLSEGPKGEKLVSVSGHIMEGDRAATVGGVHAVEGDLYASVAEATLSAFRSGK